MADQKIEIFTKQNNKYPNYPNEFWARLDNQETKWANHVTPTYLQKIKSELKIRDNDIFLVTYPRSGTTMSRRILLAMLDKMKGLETDAMLKKDETKNYDSMDLSSAFLEFEKGDYIGYECAERMFDDKIKAPIRLLKTHLHAYNAPDKMFDSKGPKVILVTRNPKDTCVSYFHMTKNNIGNGDMRNVDFNTFFEMFLKNELVNGNWIDFHNSWINLMKSKNCLDNLHVVYYEDLLQNYDETVIKMGKFIGMEEKDVEVEKLKLVSDFKKMQETVKPAHIKNYIRKGVVGDHVNYFSEEQGKKLEEKVREELDNYFSYRYE